MTTDTNQLNVNSIIDKHIQLASKNIPESNPSFIALADDTEKKELRKKLKSHHKMLSDKADEAYEKDDKELGKKYRLKAKKLAEDLDNEAKELSLSDYNVDDTEMSSPQLSHLSQQIESFQLKLMEVQNDMVSLKNAQLTNNQAQFSNSQTTKSSLSLETLKNEFEILFAKYEGTK